MRLSGQIVELLQVATGHLGALREAVEAGRLSGRALGPMNLLTAEEVARELRWSDQDCARWLKGHVPAFAHPGSRAARLYRWDHVLEALGARERASRPEATEARQFVRRPGGGAA